MSEFDAYRRYYENDINKAIAFSGKSHDFFTKVKADALLELLENLPRRGSTLDVLDVGCGHGAIHPFMQGSARPIRLTGIDVAGQVIEMAKENNPGIDYLAYDGKRIPFDDAKFDAAFTICVMHHVPPPQWPSFLSEMRRVVKPGGLIAIAEHNPLNPLTSWIVRTCPLDKNAVLLWPGRLQALMKSGGFEGIERRFILFTPIEQKFFSNLDRALSWLPLGAQYIAVGRVPH